MSEAANQVTTKRREADQVAAALRPWLQQRLGSKTIDTLRVAPPLGHGFSNDTLMIDVTVDGEASELVVQAAPTGPGLFPEYPIARMAQIQMDLRDHSDVPVPNVRWVETDPSILGAPFYVMDRVQGRMPDEAPLNYHATGWIFEASLEEREHVWRSMLAVMGRLHCFDVATHAPYLSEGRWGVELDADPAAESVRQWRDFTIWACEDDDVPPVLMDSWDELGCALPPRPNLLSVRWGDTKLGNIMFRGFDVAALLDWELVGVGPAEEDLANTVAVDELMSDLAQVPRLDGFLSREATLDTYASILGRDLMGVNWWYCFAWAKLAIECHRAMAQSRDLGTLPPDVDLESTNACLPRLRAALDVL
jgi:aminoglycoside phosphotransferase (APT) family kinase protein